MHYASCCSWGNVPPGEPLELFGGPASPVHLAVRAPPAIWHPRSLVVIRENFPFSQARVFMSFENSAGVGCNIFFYHYNPSMPFREEFISQHACTHGLFVWGLRID